MKIALVLPLLATLFVGCASTSAKDAGPAASAPGAEKSKIDELDRKLKLARARLEIKHLEEKAFVKSQESQVRFAEAAVAMAEAKLATFREADAPNKLASEELDLQTSRDRAQEAQDELAQIEIMYAEQDLDDLTAEFVVSRGRRSAERAQARIVIEESSFKALQERELPQEQQQLELTLDKARTELQKTLLEGEIGLQGKALAIQEAQDAIVKLEEELAEAKQGAKS